MRDKAGQSKDGVVKISDLYDQFDPKKACKLIIAPSPGQDNKHQLIAFNMLITWVLWSQRLQKQEESRRQEEAVIKAVRRAARITSRSIMLHLQLAAEKAYLRERNNPETPIKNRRVSSYVKYMMTLTAHTQTEEFFLFLNDIFFPLGGWGSFSKTASDAYFKKQIDAKWRQVHTVALLSDYFLRCIAAGQTEGLRRAEMPYLPEGANPEGGWLWRCAASAAEVQSRSRTG